jgi:hypothetical protein
VTPRRLLLAAGMSAAAGVAARSRPVAAQAMQTYRAARAVAAEQRLRTSIDFPGGDLFIAPARTSDLFRMELQYDADHVAPVQHYDTATATLDLGVTPVGAGIGVNARTPASQVGRFSLTTRVPIDLDVDVDGGHATIDLGGMMLSSLAVHSGATQATVDFPAPTTGNCRTATFSLTAGQLEVHHLAQAGCRAIRVTGAAGGITLAFDGEWRGNPDVTVALTMGHLMLMIPRGVGVHLATQRFLSLLDTDGFVKADDGWITPGFAAAEHRLSVLLKTSIGGVDVHWMSP